MLAPFTTWLEYLSLRRLPSEQNEHIASMVALCASSVILAAVAASFAAVTMKIPMDANVFDVSSIVLCCSFLLRSGLTLGPRVINAFLRGDALGSCGCNCRPSRSLCTGSQALDSSH